MYIVLLTHPHLYLLFFFFNDTATTEIYTLSLHDALPISSAVTGRLAPFLRASPRQIDMSLRIQSTAKPKSNLPAIIDRKSTRLNSSHGYISYAVFCLKKKKHTPS